MDVATHVLLGWSVNPELATVYGSIVPDIPAYMNIIRKSDESTKFGKFGFHLYRFTHSLLFIIICGLINPAFGFGVVLHVFVDIFTHGFVFAPRLFYPFSDIHLSGFPEWEFGSFWYYFFYILGLVSFIGRLIYESL